MLCPWDFILLRSLVSNMHTTVAQKTKGENMIDAYLYAAIIITAVLLHSFWRCEVSFIMCYSFFIAA